MICCFLKSLTKNLLFLAILLPLFMHSFAKKEQEQKLSIKKVKGVNKSKGLLSKYTKFLFNLTLDQNSCLRRNFLVEREKIFVDGCSVHSSNL